MRLSPLAPPRLPRECQPHEEPQWPPLLAGSRSRASLAAFGCAGAAGLLDCLESLPSARTLTRAQ